MPTYRISSAAAADLEEILQYIARDNVTAAERMRLRFLDAFDQLAHMPGMGHSRRDIGDQSLKTWTVKSYVVIYQIVPTGIRIHRVIHGARDFWSIFGSTD